VCSNARIHVTGEERDKEKVYGKWSGVAVLRQQGKGGEGG